MTLEEKIKQHFIKCIKEDRDKLITKAKENFYNETPKKPQLYLFLYPNDTFSFKRKQIEYLMNHEPCLFGVGRSGIPGKFTSFGYEYSHSHSHNKSHVIFYQNGVIEVGTNSERIFDNSRNVIYTRTIATELSTCLDDYFIYAKQIDPGALYNVHLILETHKNYSLFEDPDIKKYKDLMHLNSNNFTESSFEDISSGGKNLANVRKKILDSIFSSWGLPCSSCIK